VGFYRAERIGGRCVGCGFCEKRVTCPGAWECVGCRACVDACPQEAKVSVPRERPRRTVRVKIDGESHEVPYEITILKALEIAGYRISRIPGEGDISAPCMTGGCWACAVIVNGSLTRSCVTAIREGDVVVTRREAVERFEPLRIVSGFQGHTVGGVGTPYWLKPRGVFYAYIEVACFAHGCILRCPTCQNWEITYSSDLPPLTPMEAAKLITYERRTCGVDRMAISGGECTLNRRWLVEYVRCVKKLNEDPDAKIHIDTNAVVLAEDYIDELVEAGMTDIGPDVKGLRLETFQRITGVGDAELARRLLDSGWRAVEYLLDKYYEKVFVGIGVPYNEKLITLDEIAEIGERIASWNPYVQVCALDYRPEFRRMDMKRPSYAEMIRVKDTLERAGLKCVICQTTRGHVGPGRV